MTTIERFHCIACDPTIEIDDNLSIPVINTDVIMDMLGNQRMRQLITDYYQCTDEPSLVSNAVMTARSRERKISEDMLDGEGKGKDTNPSTWEKLKYVVVYVCKYHVTKVCLHVYSIVIKCSVANTSVIGH